MKLSLARLSKGFGQLATVRGTTKYHISPFEQRAFAGAITKGIPNTIWRIRASILDVAPRKSRFDWRCDESSAELDQILIIRQSWDEVLL